MNPPPDGTRKQPDSQRPVPALQAGDPVPGLSSWLLERKLGGGGFGAVWLARHAIDRERKPVAFKFCTDPDARHRLVTHERNVVARVMQHAGKHPNIVPLLEYNLDGAVPWLMYEYVEGGTLAALAEEWQALPLAKRLGRAVRVLHQIAGALAAMHRLNPPIVHRDLKPANILMAGAVPRITDFGIGSVALAKDGTGAFTARLPTLIRASGTKLYSSPEQQFGAPPAPTADVFSLGVIAFQLVSDDAVAQPGSDVLAELREQKVPTELASLIVRSLDFYPERRPKDAGEWVSVLGALIARYSSQPEASNASVPVLIAESGSVPGLVPTSVPPAQANSSSPSKPPVVLPLPTLAGSEPEIKTERGELFAEEIPDEPPKRRRGLIAVLVVACVALAIALFAALSEPMSSGVAKKPPEQQPEVPAPKPKQKESEPTPKEKEPAPKPKDKEPEPKVVPKPKVATFPANPKAGDEYDIEIAPNTKMRFCYIPAGECQLGSPGVERLNLKGFTGSEAEQVRGNFHTKGFWMGKYEVTQAEWAAVMRGTQIETPSDFRRGGASEKALGEITDTSRFPVENVSWYHCQEFLKRANAYRVSLGDKGALDLPHEDEWEYACRGGLGNKQPFYFGNALNGTQANCEGNVPFGTTTKGGYLKRPQPVGKYEVKAPHPWGLCDTHGNVWEWCRNTLAPSTSHVLRGGSWSNEAHGCRAARRASSETTGRNDLGFRVFFPIP